MGKQNWYIVIMVELNIVSFLWLFLSDEELYMTINGGKVASSSKWNTLLNRANMLIEFIDGKFKYVIF